MGFSSPTGKPLRVYSDDSDRGDTASNSSAIPLRDAFEDNDDGLPAYTDEPPTRQALVQHNPEPLSAPEHDFEVIRRTDINGSTLYRLSNVLTTDPPALKAFILSEAAIAPEPVIHLYGYHTETIKDHGKKNSSRVVDFDITISVPETIERNHPRNNPPTFLKEHCILDLYHRERKAYRGGRFRSQGKKLSHTEAPSLPPTLDEWCHLFCASRAQLKSFTLKKSISGRDEAFLRSSLEGIIRSTNYRGHIDINLCTYPHSVTVLAPSRMNRWRHNNYVWWFCVITQLWLITWPLLFLMTPRWQVLEAIWPYKVQPNSDSQGTDAGRWGYGEPGDSCRYVQLSEKAWIRTWTRAIKLAVEFKTKAIISCEYLEELEHASGTQGVRGSQSQLPESQPSGFMGAAMGLVRGISGALEERERRFGWGGDT